MTSGPEKDLPTPDDQGPADAPGQGPAEAEDAEPTASGEQEPTAAEAQEPASSDVPEPPTSAAQPTPQVDEPPTPETQEPAEPEAPAPQDGKPAEPPSAWQILRRALFSRVTPTHLLVGLLCALLGFAVVAQVRQTRDESLSSLRQSDLVRILDEVTQRSNELETQLASLEASRNDLRTGSEDTEAALEAARQRAATQGLLSGRLPAEGPGVRVTIVEGADQLRSSTLVTILEELRNAGAEAIELNGIRIVASSYFVDSPQGLVADGQTLSSPYVWLAIGNPDTLAPALEIPGGAMATVRAGGASGTIRTDEEITIEATREPAAPEFAVPVIPEADL